MGAATRTATTIAAELDSGRNDDIERWMTGAGPAEVARAREEWAAVCAGAVAPSSLPAKEAPPPHFVKRLAETGLLLLLGVLVIFLFVDKFIRSLESSLKDAVALVAAVLFIAGSALFTLRKLAFERRQWPRIAERLGGTSGTGRAREFASWIIAYWAWVTPRDMVAQRHDEDRTDACGAYQGFPVMVVSQSRASKTVDPHPEWYRSSSTTRTTTPGLYRASIFVASSAPPGTRCEVAEAPAIALRGFFALRTPAGIYAYRTGGIPAAEDVLAVVEAAVCLLRRHDAGA
jgi:hypothetical protein